MAIDSLLFAAALPLLSDSKSSHFHLYCANDIKARICIEDLYRRTGRRTIVEVGGEYESSKARKLENKSGGDISK